MPRLSICFIRTSLIYLALGFTFGGLLLLNKSVLIYPQIWRLLPAHIESVLFGWTVQLVMGVAFWILPRFQKPPLRGNEKLAWGAYFLVNFGILSSVTGSFVVGNQCFNLIGKTTESLGVLAFVVHAWPRVKGF